MSGLWNTSELNRLIGVSNLREILKPKTCQEVYRKYNKFDDLIMDIKETDEICNLKLTTSMLKEFWEAIKYTVMIQTDDGK